MSYHRHTKSSPPPSPSRRQRILPRHSSQTLKAVFITSILALLTFLHYHPISYDLSLRPSPHRPEDATFSTTTSTSSPSSATKNTKNTPRIAILTFTTKFTSYTHLSLANKAHYARLHNYDLHVDYELPASSSLYGPDLMWHKFGMLSSAINSGNYDWVWFADFDTLITNMSISLPSIIDDALTSHAPDTEAGGTEKRDRIDWLLTPDCFALNAGSFIVRAHKRSMALVELAKTEWLRAGTPKSEQDCLRDVLFPPSAPLANGDESWLVRSAKSKYAGRFLMLPQKKINAFPPEIKCVEKASAASPSGEWRRGDFVVHFAGAWAYVEGEDATGVLMRKYADMVVWGDVRADEEGGDGDEDGDEGVGLWRKQEEEGRRWWEKVGDDVVAKRREDEGVEERVAWFGQGDGVSVSVSGGD